MKEKVEWRGKWRRKCSELGSKIEEGRGFEKEEVEEVYWRRKSSGGSGVKRKQEEEKKETGRRREKEPEKLNLFFNPPLKLTASLQVFINDPE